MGRAVNNGSMSKNWKNIVAVELNTLRNRPIFRELSESGLQLIASSSVPVNIAHGARAFSANNACDMMPILFEGNIRDFLQSPNGREITLYRVSQSQLCILTISCLLGNNTYPAAGEAEEEVHGVGIPKSIFLKLIETEAYFRERVFDSFALRITELMQLLDAVTFKKLDQRLITFLVERGPIIDLSHQEIADELGSVREIVSRLLKQFEEKSWVQLSRKQIQVCDPNQLSQYIND